VGEKDGRPGVGPRAEVRENARPKVRREGTTSTEKNTKTTNVRGGGGVGQLGEEGGRGGVPTGGGDVVFKKKSRGGETGKKARSLPSKGTLIFPEGKRRPDPGGGGERVVRLLESGQGKVSGKALRLLTRQKRD